MKSVFSFCLSLWLLVAAVENAFAKNNVFDEYEDPDEMGIDWTCKLSKRDQIWSKFGWPVPAPNKPKECPGVGSFPTDGVFRHLPAPKCVEEFGMEFRLYTRAYVDEWSIITRTDKLPEQFNSSNPTVFIVHGYQSSGGEDWLNEIRTNILQQEDSNVIQVDWSAGAKGRYSHPASNTRTVGAEIALVAERLLQEPSSVQDVWCIGHSLGAHTCGFAGRRMQQDGLLMTRITGLDPAGPCFDTYSEEIRLNSECAGFVDVIHTAGLWLGLMNPSGHVDFYPNGGSVQPGCKSLAVEIARRELAKSKKKAVVNDVVKELMVEEDPDSLPEEDVELGGFFDPTCSHTDSHEYFIESFREGCFIASYHKCADPEDAEPSPNSCKPCLDEDCPQMGYNAEDTRHRGIFYLETNASPPFCLGINKMGVPLHLLDL